MGREERRYSRTFLAHIATSKGYVSYHALGEFFFSITNFDWFSAFQNQNFIEKNSSLPYLLSISFSTSPSPHPYPCGSPGGQNCRWPAHQCVVPAVEPGDPRHGHKYHKEHLVPDIPPALASNRIPLKANPVSTTYTIALLDSGSLASRRILQEPLSRYWKFCCGSYLNLSSSESNSWHGGCDTQVFDGPVSVAKPLPPRGWALRVSQFYICS